MKKYLIGLGVFIAALVLVRIFLVEMYVVRKNSMNNTLQSGDRVLIIKQFSRIEHNRIVVFTHEGNTMIKRCVGLPGDTVQLAGDTLYINNTSSPNPSKAILFAANSKQEADPFIAANYGTNWQSDKFGPYTVPYKGMKIRLTKESMALYRSAMEQDVSSGALANELPGPYYTFSNDFYFLLGDNRPGSQDSRLYGPVVRRNIKGKVFLTF